MTKSASLRVADVRAILRLVSDCRDLGDDAGIWRRHLFAGLGQLVGGGVVIGGEMAIGPPGPRDLGTAEWGWENGFNRAGWLASLDHFRDDPSFSPIFNGYLARLTAEDGVCLSRPEVVPDREWYPSPYFEAVQRVIGVDDMLVCFHSVPGAAMEFSGMFLGRAPGEPSFTARERAMVREAHAEVARLLGGPLARTIEPCPSELPPRTRQVLRCVLEGDTDKQVALRLGVTRHTVNQYLKSIYRHFQVTGRSELLARWVRRGWGIQFRWTEEP